MYKGKLNFLLNKFWSLPSKNHTSDNWTKEKPKNKKASNQFFLQESESLLKGLTCVDIIHPIPNKNYFVWKAILAMDREAFITVSCSEFGKYVYEPLLHSKLSKPLQILADLELAANLYLSVSKNGMDLLVNRLFPNREEFNLNDNDWIAYNGLDAANKILLSRSYNNESRT